MDDEIRESAWKLFRAIHPIALDRSCERVLSEVTRLATDTNTPSHGRYLLVSELTRQRDADIAAAFSQLRRSTALHQLAIMQNRELLTEEEFGRFTPEARDRVNSLIEVYRPG